MKKLIFLQIKNIILNLQRKKHFVLLRSSEKSTTKFLIAIKGQVFLENGKLKLILDWRGCQSQTVGNKAMKSFYYESYLHLSLSPGKWKIKLINLFYLIALKTILKFWTKNIKHIELKG